MKKDQLFRKPLARIADFEFNEAVVEVFDDMIDRSVPFYGEVQRMIVDYVAEYYQQGTNVYDLGCSTGAMSAALLGNLPELEHVVAVDGSEAMVDKCRQNLDEHIKAGRIRCLTEDLRDTQIENASAVIMNYTLQFIRPLYRQVIVRNIFNGLKPGGIFILSEKVLEDSTHLSRTFMEMYYLFKRRMGYSELEISQKREMLENVLVPYKVGEQVELLRNNGFADVEIFFKWNNFASFIAVKG